MSKLLLAFFLNFSLPHSSPTTTVHAIAFRKRVTVTRGEVEFGNGNIGSGIHNNDKASKPTADDGVAVSDAAAD